ncbi:MAG TPA: DMT family transporter [Caulobacter sp.]|nr:DMT family transporter [Caulobacter sp.]
MLWIPATIAAAAFQVARNAAQRSLMTGAGPWGATLVRFLFGLPFSCAFVAAALALMQDDLRYSLAFFAWATLGAFAQMGATAAMLVAMQRSSFALGTAFQQSGLPFAAIIGLFVFGDSLSPAAWIGILLATAGLTALSWPRRIEGPRDWSAAGLGTLSGASFAVSANAFRQAALALDPEHAVPAALVAVAVVQAIQSAALGAWMLAFARPSLMAVLRSWRVSIGAGLFGALASAGWFIALALAPAGLVRAVGVVEMPIAALAGRRLFREHVSRWQWLCGGATAAGVLLAALG